MSASVLPTLFYKRWNENYKHSHKFSEHDNHDVIKNFGEYVGAGFGKRYYHDTAHESNDVFLSREPFVKREPHEIYYRQLRTNSTPAYTYHKRFPKRHETKLTSAGEHSRVNLDEYLELKQARHPVNSLNFESEIVNKHKVESAKLIANQPFRKHFIHPWKYSYKKTDYQTCSEEFRRVRTQCIDLSKY